MTCIDEHSVTFAFWREKRATSAVVVVVVDCELSRQAIRIRTQTHKHPS